MTARNAVLLAVAVVLVGCGGTLPTHIYSLPPVETPKGPARLPGVLMVQRFTADSVLNSRRIAWRANPEAFTVGNYPDHLWSLAPPEQLQIQLGHCLAGAGVAERVVPDSAPVQADWILSGRLGHFEQQLTGPPDGRNNARVQLEADLILTRVRGQRQPVWQATLAAAVALPDADPASVADGMYQAIGALCARLVQQLTAAPIPRL